MSHPVITNIKKCRGLLEEAAELLDDVVLGPNAKRAVKQFGVYQDVFESSIKIYEIDEALKRSLAKIPEESDD